MLKSRFNSLKVMASPSLGGMIDVSLNFCKKWDLALNEDVLGEPDFDDDEPNQAPNLPNDEVETMTPEEQAEIGFYNGYKILKHKFQQGWKFLVWWENFPASASTWEPTSAFLLPNGSVNSVFKTYCQENGLTHILQKALSA